MTRAVGWRLRSIAAFARCRPASRVSRNRSRVRSSSPTRRRSSKRTRPAAFDIKDPMAVLAYVLGSLPERVTVYPTENYYYFKFVHAGVPIAGNLRLDPRDRDKGKVYFAYYEDNADWKDDGFEQALELDGSAQRHWSSGSSRSSTGSPIRARACCSRSTTCRRSSRRPARSAPTSA